MSWFELYGTLHTIFVTQMGFLHVTPGHVLMSCVGLVLMWLATAKNFEPLLLVPIGFGVFIVNFPMAPLMEWTEAGHPEFINVFCHYGLEWEVIPAVIFLGLGTLTDFGPLIANPKVLVIGAGAQLGVFVTFIGTLLCGFTLKEAASMGIIGGADGPTTIYLTTALAPHLLGANAVASDSWLSLSEEAAVTGRG
jgi:oxaloacetate decarboxylase beta subunit